MSTFPGAFVPVAPPADGLRLAFVAARRRRNRKAGATGAVGLLAAVALLAATGGAGDRTLLQEPLPPASGTGLGVLPGPAPSAGAIARPASPVASEVTSVGRASEPTAAEHVAEGTPVGAAQPAEARAGRLRTVRSGSVSGPMTRSYTYGYTNGDLICPARKQQERQRSICTDVWASPSSNGTTRITAEVCNVGTASESLSFPTARELDLTIRQSGLEIWRWSLGHQFAAEPHDAQLPVGECLTWATDWSQINAHGVRVKNGSYEVVADFDADEVSGPERHPSYSITISQQP